MFFVARFKTPGLTSTGACQLSRPRPNLIPQDSRTEFFKHLPKRSPARRKFVLQLLLEPTTFDVETFWTSFMADLNAKGFKRGFLIFLGWATTFVMAEHYRRSWISLNSQPAVLIDFLFQEVAL